MLIRPLLLMCVAASIALLLPSCDDENPIQSKTVDTVIVTTLIRDFEYADGRIFDLGLPGQFEPNDIVSNLLVFEARPFATPEEALQLPYGVLSVDPTDEVDPWQVGMKVEQIDIDHYQWYEDAQSNQHYLVFDSARTTFALGVWMVINSGSRLDTIGSISGSLSADDTLHLKMLKPNGNGHITHPTWPLMWRNVYRIPRGATAEELNLKVLKGPAGSEYESVSIDYQQVGAASETYLAILGLDQYNNSTDVKRPDELLDDRRAVLESEWGLLVFPHRTPFDSDTAFFDVDGNWTPYLEDLSPHLYEYVTMNERTSNSKYFIRYETRMFVPF
jgi:hypothetical protein